MKRKLQVLALAAAITATGCVSQSQMLASRQSMAMQTAVTRGKFEMNCADATPTLLSQEVVEPVLQGPLVGGIQRLEYTIGVSGCGDRKTFVVICPEGGEGCFAAGPGRFLQDQ